MTLKATARELREAETKAKQARKLAEDAYAAYQSCESEAGEHDELAVVLRERLIRDTLGEKP